MDELQEFCVRMLGRGDTAAEAARAAREAGADDRLAQLVRAVEICRDAASGATAETGRQAGPPTAETELSAAPATPGGELPAEPAMPVGGLSATVAGELATASARLPQRQREALALRELLRLSHEQIGEVIGIEPVAVAPLLARARLRLRAELRGSAMPASDCPERDRTLRTATLRQDGEPVSSADDDWFVDHLGHCDSCARLHAALLEGSVCYRGWPVSPPARLPST